MINWGTKNSSRKRQKNLLENNKNEIKPCTNFGLVLSCFEQPGWPGRAVQNLDFKGAFIQAIYFLFVLQIPAVILHGRGQF